MTPSSAPDISAAIRHCREVTRRSARNFYYALKISPEPQRSALYVVYAWMRRADDLGDTAGGDAASRRRTVEAFRAKTDAALDGSAPDGDPLWSVPNLYITPHNSGDSPTLFADSAAAFTENLRRYVAGEPLENVVDRAFGY